MAFESPYQHTLGGEVVLSGVGVHSGQPARLRLLPSEPDTGLRFRRVDLPGAPEIPATLDYVLADQLARRTTLGLGRTVSVATVEHLLACCLALGVDNAVFEVNAEEMPFFDGSAQSLAHGIQQVGVVAQNRARQPMTIHEPVVFNRYPVQMAAFPSHTLRITYFLDFDSAAIPKQSGHYEITGESFLRELSPARTFCLWQDVQPLLEQGLIKGGSLDCAIVIDGDRLLNGPLRFPDECVRHKAIDLLGDLCLLGRPIRAHLTAWRAGHLWHFQFLRELQNALVAVENSPRTPCEKQVMSSPDMRTQNKEAFAP
ncbi:MAG: UDP-3-O-acyl-N-acetylglucosamine deacetylase [Candidatus Sumerlaeia bacterium]|nr:UDP-3-O-acyl-N-acetylglucosamine deacetylase [Candidatus Sumerlaeia bacterium]